jgi:hypothetical protein
MKKEKVYIVVSHRHVLKTPGTKNREPVWEVAESVEFVNQLRNKHLTTSSAIGDYINRKMEKGERHGMGDYDKFEEYVRSKYAKEMAELDKAYRAQVIFDVTPPEQEVFADEFGNLRARTVFDKAAA